MSRDELIRLVEGIMAAEGATEREEDAMLRLLERNVSHPRVSDLIFYSDPPLSAAQVVDIASSYRPFAL
ncbi:bacteriocin immunity protein [Streptomyces sp. MB09-02B]|nr:bacteriocin immunity protein [Streptomyces sp. MB09-02B]